MRNEIKALTGVRGIAALYVACYHFTYEGGLGPGLVRRMLGHGYLAVDLFFILSGFVMALTYAERFRNGRWLPGFGDFIARRLARIYPLYIVLTLVCAAVAYAGWNAQWAGWKTELVRLGINGTLMQAMHGGLSVDLPAWSISTEMIAYLLFPLLCAAAQFCGWRQAAATAVLCGLTMVALSLAPSDWLLTRHREARLAWLDISDGRTFFPVARCVAEFTIGLLVWRVSTGNAGRWLQRQRWTGTTLAALLMVLLCCHDVDALTALLFAPMILCLATDRSLVTRALASPVPVALGVISYSLYLLHAPIRDLCEYAIAHGLGGRVPGGRGVITAAELAITIALSFATYRIIELPGRRHLQRLLSSSLGPAEARRA